MGHDQAPLCEVRFLKRGGQWGDTAVEEGQLEEVWKIPSEKIFDEPGD
jgi:hypothetical protein